MFASVTHILPNTTIRRERLLQLPGKVMVRKGQKVNATDTVAEANLAPEHLLLDVARGLGMRTGQTDDHIKVKAGDQVSAGDVVAGPVGLTRRVLRSTHNGRVILAGHGQILLVVESRPFALKAGLPGEVMELIPDRGAIIETNGALIQAVWGNGSIDAGLLSMLASQPDHLLTSDQLDVSLRGAVVAAGHCAAEEVLTTAAELPVRGLILSSLEASLATFAAGLSIPLVLTEGFGRRPVNSLAFKLLSDNARQEVALNAEPWDVYAGTRPEIIIPLPGNGETTLPDENGFLSPGKRVRIVRAPHAGKIGNLVSLSRQEVFHGGVRAAAAEVQLEDGTSAMVLQANMELLE